MIVRIGERGQGEQLLRACRRPDRGDAVALEAYRMIADGGRSGRRQDVGAMEVAHDAPVGNRLDHTLRLGRQEGAAEYACDRIGEARSKGRLRRRQRADAIPSETITSYGRLSRRKMSMLMRS